MAAEASSPPSGQRTNYSRQLRAAEEVVAGVVDTVLTEGGHVLWHKYLERKAFRFAAETMTEAVAAHLRTCFVAHDSGEEDLEDGWTLEEEPCPGEIDSWARMHVALRRPPKRAMESDSGGGRGGTGRQPVPKRAARASDVRGKAAGRGRGGNSVESKDGGKSFAIEEEFTIDPEEEAFRDQKRQEETAKRETENKAKQSERDQEEDRKKQTLLHEEMDKRPHTFDFDGNILWVDEVKTEKLPKVQEIFTWAEGRKDPRSNNLDSTNAAGKTSASAASSHKKTDRRPRNNRTSHDNQKEPDFTDGFSKLQQCQPPITETMTVKAGVVLESAGKTKQGPQPQNPNRQMSRTEYLQYVEREVGGQSQDGPMPGDQPQAGHQPGGDGTKASGGDATKATGGEAPPSRQQAGGRVSGSRELPGAETEGSKSATELPAINPGRGPASQATPSGAKGPVGGRVGGGMGAPAPPPAGGEDSRGDSRGGKLQRAPPAPDPKHRMKKHEAVGHLAFSKPPRYHVAPLGGGGPGERSGPQPPLGATMGHGLVRSGSLKEAFYFPDPAKLPPGPLGRAASESALLPRMRAGPGGASGGTPTGRGFGAHADPDGAMTAKEEAASKRMGKIVPDTKSSVYRDMRARFNAGTEVN